MISSNAADSSPCLTAGRMANIPFMRMGYSLWMRLLEQLDALDALLGGGTAPEACGPPRNAPQGSASR